MTDSAQPLAAKKFFAKSRVTGDILYVDGGAHFGRW